MQNEIERMRKAEAEAEEADFDLVDDGDLGEEEFEDEDDN